MLCELAEKLAEMLCELAEKLMGSGTSPRPGSCGSRLTPTTPGDVWI